MTRPLHQDGRCRREEQCGDAAGGAENKFQSETLPLSCRSCQSVAGGHMIPGGLRCKGGSYERECWTTREDAAGVPPRLFDYYGRTHLPTSPGRIQKEALRSRK